MSVLTDYFPIFSGCVVQPDCGRSFDDGWQWLVRAPWIEHGRLQGHCLAEPRGDPPPANKESLDPHRPHSNVHHDQVAIARRGILSRHAKISPVTPDGINAGPHGSHRHDKTSGCDDEVCVLAAHPTRLPAKAVRGAPPKTGRRRAQAPRQTEGSRWTLTTIPAWKSASPRT